MRNHCKFVILLGFFLIVPSVYLLAQVGINADNSSPDNSAMLDVKSSNMGFLFPRLSDAARNSIPSPGTGLVIYNTTTNLLNYFNGSEWQQVSVSISSTTTGSLKPGGGVSINANPATPPDSSAMLDVNNPSRGIRIPRTNPNLISTPAIGLIVYNTSTNLINYYNGNSWRELCAISTGISGGTGNQSALGVSINSNGTTVHPSAILEISAPDKGILIPRLTTNQRSALSPVAGLTIYNLNSNEIELYNGIGWNKLNVNACAVSCPGIPTVIYGGKIYNTLQVGTQCWLKENLNIGTRINSIQEQTNNGIIEKYCYNNLESNCTIYGGLYQWNEMMGYITTAGLQAICPQGWHVSTDAEWTTLSTYLGGEWVAGGKIKSTGTMEDGTGLWNSPNTGATNETGFSGLPAGFRDNVGATYNGSINGGWWTSSKYNDSFAWRWVTSSADPYLVRGNRTEVNGYPVRCVKTTCSSAPITPTTGTHSPLENLIVWNWSAVANATGYKWSSVNNFTNSTEMGTATTWSEMGLNCNTPYTRYVWAYNACGNSTPVILNASTLACGSVGGPCPGIPTVIYNNQTYNTVQIGTQCWFKENLNAGTRIDGMQESSNNYFIEKYCYDNLESNCAIYGGLYQWNEMMEYELAEGSQGICPTGWHIPTDAQWTTLATFLGGDNVAGGKMKSTGNLTEGTGLWYYPNYGATNESGFTAVPGGGRADFGSYYQYGGMGYWWSSSVSLYYGDFPIIRDLTYNDSFLNSVNYEKNYGISVRCLKDQCSSAPVNPYNGQHIPSQNQIIWNWSSVTDAVGYKWNTVNNYATAIDLGSAISHTQTGLSCNNAYTCYVWAYNACGYSFPINMTQSTLACGPMGVPCPGLPTITYGGQVYNTVQIGTQCWLKENLNIGTKINGTQDQTNNGVIEKYCINNLETNCNLYGGLYQWNEMMAYDNTAGIQAICPPDWHTSTQAEWTTLYTFIGGDGVAGGKLKSTGTTEAGTGLWHSPNTGATNESNFTALPGGWRNSSGTLTYHGSGGFWWSSSMCKPDKPWCYELYSYDDFLRISLNTKNIGYSVRCVKNTCSSAPVAPTSGANMPLEVLVVWNWSVVANATGYKWSTTNNYANAIEIGTDTVKIEPGLICNTAYTRYVWAYNACGHSTPVVLNQTTMPCGTVGPPCPGTPTVNYGGQVYNTVQIGTQCWLKENLNIGTRINSTQEQTNNNIIEKYCYDNLESNCAVYGGLYQWNEMMQYSISPGVKGICPSGWHIPTDAQWTTVTTFLGGTSVAGWKMKTTGTIEAGTGLWLFPNTGVTNESGFTAVPAGYRYVDGTISTVTGYGYWWSSSEDNTSFAWLRSMSYNSPDVGRVGYYTKNFGVSVRCLRD